MRWGSRLAGGGGGGGGGGEGADVEVGLREGSSGRARVVVKDEESKGFERCIFLRH